MTDLLTLTWASDNEVDQDTFNLLDFAQGFTLPDGGWIPQTMSDDQVTCTETLTFYMQGASHDSIAGFMQVLDDWKRRVKWSADPTQARVVWLNARWKSETNTRRACVWSLNYSLGSSPFSPYLRESNFMPTFTIVIDRGWWEELTPLIMRMANLSAAGGSKVTRDATDSANQIITGDVGARVISISDVNVGSDLKTYWHGFRSSYLGSLSKFRSTWELESSSVLGADTSVVADATASAGNKLTTTFATVATLTYRARILATDVAGADDVEQRGQYVCLVRAKMSDASAARLRVKSGFFASGSSPYIVNPRVSIAGTSWLLYEAGIVRMPATDEKNSLTLPGSSMGIEIDAERVSGSGNLEMDCMYLIPINDSFSSMDFSSAVAVARTFTTPLEKNYATTDEFMIGDLNTITWSIPANNEAALLVVAGQRNGSHALTDSFTASVRAVRRWRTLRGTE